MRSVRNVIWWAIAGLWMSMGYMVGGVLMCLTVVGIPFGIQAFKFARFVWWPFGKALVEVDTGALTSIFNVLWAAVIGIWLAIGHVLVGIVLMLTIVGIPFGFVSFRLAGSSLMPFGRRIVDADAAPSHARSFGAR